MTRIGTTSRAKRDPIGVPPTPAARGDRSSDCTRGPGSVKAGLGTRWYTEIERPRYRAFPVARNGFIPPRDVLDRQSWRCIGPYRGGRVVAVAGHPTERNTYYFGSTGGGVWRSDDAGIYWRNVSDAFFRRASVGAMAVAEADPKVLYVGMGERCIR